MVNPEKNDDFFDKIEVFSSEDDKLKFLGELLSNESSRKLFLLLTTQEMSASEISEKISLRLSSVIHHLNKMQQIGIVEISKIGKNTKNHDVKYYSAKPGIMIFPSQIAEKAKRSKTFVGATKNIMKFATIGIASWAITYFIQTLDDKGAGVHYPDKYFVPDEFIVSSTIALIVVFVSLVTNRMIKSRRKN